MWITHFTCLVTRAVHLDIVSDMLTGTFVCCLKRFTARRGLPYKFLSDNGKTFKSTAKLLKAIFKDKTVEDYLSSHGCQWTFNLARAGVYERMVQSTKRCLRKMLGRASLSYEELLTVIVEIEGMINSRPISYISAADREEPLTPSHLIVGRRLLSLPDHLSYVHDTQDEDFEVNASQLSKRLKHLNGVINHFWNRWRSEYLNELRECHRHAAGKTSQPVHVAVGEVVVVRDDTLPRSFWKLGRIQDVITG